MTVIVQSGRGSGGWEVSVLKYSQRQLKYEERNTCVIARKIKASNFQLRVKKKKKQPSTYIRKVFATLSALAEE